MEGDKWKRKAVRSCKREMEKDKWKTRNGTKEIK